MSNEQKPRTKSVEQTSMSVPFFTLAAILFLLSIWAVINEVGAKRVWKQYQAEFENIAADQVRAEIEAEVARLQSETTLPDGVDKLPPLPQIEQKLQEAKAVMSSSEYVSIEDQIKKQERTVYLAVQDWKIFKSLDVEHAFFYEEALKKEKTLEEQAARGEATELEVSNAKAES
ncbi:MAG: hypothetical protein KDH09_08320, partial [Chrysiogenetes bacterium]|nr:hypothetical protein [Chrysiogenetes bacterium]